MSETQTPAEPTDADLDAIAIGDVPEPEAPAAAPEPEPEAPEEPAAAEAPEEPAEPEKPSEPPYMRKRIDQLSREKGEAERRANLAETRLAETQKALEAAQAGQPADTTKLTDDEVEARAQKRAREIVSTEQQEARNANFVKTGNAEFSDFNDRCAVVAEVADTIHTNKKFELMAVIGAMDDGPRVVAHLADNAEEAARILAKPAHLMALDLAKVSNALAAKAVKPAAPVSKAPKPITPVGGTTTAAFDPLDDRLNMEDWNRMMDKRDAAKRKAGMRL